LYRAFLNAATRPAAVRGPAPRPLAAPGEWYAASGPWVKVLVSEDGVYRLTADWLRGLGLDPGAIDPRTLQLYYLGEEQYLHVAGEADGRLDDGDEVLFYGRYRRAEGESGPARDFDSAYGRTNTYWLTWGGPSGRRYAPRSGAPVNGYPVSTWYRTTTHVEVDRTYQQFPDAPDDAVGDHWFWQSGNPSRFPYPDHPGAATFTGELSAPDLGEDYTARLRVALHGHSLLGQHHSFIQLNGNRVAERIWEGQSPLVIDEEVPSSWLVNGTNRIILQGLADLTREDLVWFNWFEVVGRRLYYAWPGFMAWDEAATTGRRTTLFGFQSPEVVLLDAANGTWLTDLATGARDSLLTATFEDRNAAPARYVAADRDHLRTPGGQVDETSAWRRPENGADYVILTHPLFAAAAAELAAHRRQGGLETAVVLTDDVYDEFSYGRFTSDAIRDFLAYAYHSWSRPPAYVLLLGDGTWDYRNIYGSYVPSFVPTLYYDALHRGISPSDYLYALVDGDDLLADLSVGRLAVETPEEALGAVRKIIDYDRQPAAGDWRSRAVYTAAFDDSTRFAALSDSLAARYTEPLGLRSVRVYDTDEGYLPKPIGRDFLEALNAGALVFSFVGHGAASFMQPFFSIQGTVIGSGTSAIVVPEWDYLAQVANGRRLPLMVALSCLNGMFVHPQKQAEALAEVFTSMADGGAIAFISSAAISYVGGNDLLADGLYQQLFERDVRAFGPALDGAKARVLAAAPAYGPVVKTMLLFGDPAQELALSPAAEYEALSLAIDPPQPTTGSTARLVAALRNNTRLSTDSIAVALLAADPQGAVDTLAWTRRPAFAGADTLALDWPVGARGGPYRLTLAVDAGDAVAEEDEGNNHLEVYVDVLEAAMAEPVYPMDGAEVAAADLVLVVATALDADLSWAPYTCEASLSAEAAFPPTATLELTAAPDDGRCVFPVPEVAAAPDGGAWHWRARLLDDKAPGP
ncbi:MAG: C25 family cysteine peptidase, partial [Gemmatimonadota bacterium]